jgi:hypothetical protein
MNREGIDAVEQWYERVFFSYQESRCAETEENVWK